MKQGSVIASSQSEIDRIDASVDLPLSNRNKNEGRLTGRANSLKQQHLSKSMAETSIKQMRDNSTE